MRVIAEKIVAAINETTNDYDAIDVAIKILEKHVKRTTTPLRVKPNEGTLVSFSHKKFKKKTL
jgi:hypothetical protein